MLRTCWNTSAWPRWAVTHLWAKASTPTSWTARVAYVPIYLTVLRLGQDHYRVVDGADAGHRDLTLDTPHGTGPRCQCDGNRYHHAVWLPGLGPNAHATIQGADGPSMVGRRLPLCGLRELKIKASPVLAFHISYVGEQAAGTALQV